ncbi:uncharacterized protein RSE6_03992 [Rhynchosporium secalis]|uniref:Uncharacterized protein n=1 Tax=Rhynchosporium secalis TaxID=38038 RepID=A0A1E1M450_RHYSE|nr:uncharacterized protein RSE6_03992 [Rhynchosporium secalis]
MFSTTLQRLAAQPKGPIPIPLYSSPYKATRLWPPDFSKIDRKAQFRLERKYKRRAKLKWARPRWTKFVKIVQMSSILFIAVYGVLFLDWNQQGNPDHKPFEGIRTWFFGLTGNIWTKDQIRRESDSDEATPKPTGTAS